MKAWNEECAVFGIWGDPEASKMTFLGLYAQQHRGQESAGIVSLNEGHHVIDKGMGLVGDIFKEKNLQRLKGKSAIGHVRYSTTGRNLVENAQPLTAQLLNGPIAMAHNGNIVNSGILREALKKNGAIFQGTNDTECLLHFLAQDPRADLKACLIDAAKKLEGAFSMVFMSHKEMFAFRDPMGFRPLVLGKRKHEEGGESYVVASETCAFDLIGAELVREIEPGEIIKISNDGIESERFAPKAEKLSQCVFEHVYFARPDSEVFGKHVYSTRKAMGRELAKEAPIEADVVIPVPDSGIPAAVGYSEESKIPFELGIIRNHYVGRTFIQPTQSIRSFGVKIKLNPQKAILEGKRVVVVDDSVVRGTTSKKIISLVRQAGAKEVHFRVSSPPTTGPCYYGVDTPKKEQLIASHKSVEEIKEYIGADSLSYLSHDGLKQAVVSKEEEFSYCSACFSGDYPTNTYQEG